MPSLRFLGHSACEVVEGDTRVLIDPFLPGNPLAAAKAEELNATAVLLTHAHNDHLGDALAIAKRCDVPIVAIFELATWCQQQGAKSHGLSIGGAHSFPWGWVKLTQAWHGSTYIDEKGQFHTLGPPAGILLRVGDKLLYHAGGAGRGGGGARSGRRGGDRARRPI